MTIGPEMFGSGFNIGGATAAPPQPQSTFRPPGLLPAPSPTAMMLNQQRSQQLQNSILNEHLKNRPTGPTFGQQLGAGLLSFGGQGQLAQQLLAKRQKEQERAFVDGLAAKLGGNQLLAQQLLRGMG